MLVRESFHLRDNVLQPVMPVLVILNEGLLVKIVSRAILKWSVDGDSEPKIERLCFTRDYLLWMIRLLLLVWLQWAAVAHV